VLVCGLILAGGLCSRFGADKAFAELAGSPLIAHVARALRARTATLAVSGGCDAARFLDVPLLPDPPGCPRGPLSGVLAGLQWAGKEGADWLVTATCDVPLIPADMAALLVEAAQAKGADLAIAKTEDGPHPLCAAWKPRLHSRVATALKHGMHPAIRTLAAEMSAVEVQFPRREQFFNVNSPSDLTAVERYVRGGLARS
jgi:molybdopterin-guanine dinucleotide biosynthesis protein A